LVAIQAGLLRQRRRKIREFQVRSEESRTG
jgi:hypothetical protein